MTTIQQAIELRAEGKPEEAKTILLELLPQSPDDPDIHYQLAWVHDMMGLESEAVPYYEKAISLGLKDPERCGALLGLEAHIVHWGCTANPRIYSSRDCGNTPGRGSSGCSTR